LGAVIGLSETLLEALLAACEYNAA